MRNRWGAGLAVGLMLASVAMAGPVDRSLEADARFLIGELAGPNFRGRQPEKPDFALAAGWCVAWLQLAGLEPGAPDGTFFQRFLVTRVVADEMKTSLKANPTARPLTYGFDYNVTARSEADEKLRFAFVRLVDRALTAAEVRRLEGRVVVVHPLSKRELVPGLTSSTTAQGVVPRLTAGLVATNGTLRPVPATVISGIPGAKGMTALRLTYDAAAGLARDLGAEKYVATDALTTSIETPPGAYLLSIKISVESKFESMNVIAKVTGRDAKLNGEAVLIGAHLDHLGETRDGSIAYGADDNASGVAAAMMIGRDLARPGNRPRRTVLIGLWSCEEKGLYGSQVYASRPSIPLESTVAYLNMDMVGRDAEYPTLNDKPEDNRNSIYAGSAKLSSPDLHALLHRANANVGLILRDDKTDRTMRSDTGSFYRHRVPVLKAWTGEHPDYHRTTDTVEKVNYPKVAKVTAWLLEATNLLANQNGRPKFVAGGRLLTGRITTATPLNPPPDAVAYVSLYERTGSAIRLIDRTTQPRPGQTPIYFAVRYQPNGIRADRTYFLRAEITKSGKPWLRSPDVMVLAPGMPLAAIEVKMPAATS